MSDKNKACPFCGSTDISDGEIGSHEIVGNQILQYSQSECQECFAVGPRAILLPDEVDYGDIKAIEAWNRRAG